ncbi:hypothetical protein GCM10022221_76760 [Actinocorallia aurea]
MPACCVVFMRMRAVRFVSLLGALVHLPAHEPMEMTVVYVVDMSFMSKGHMTASLAMRMVGVFVR